MTYQQILNLLNKWRDGLQACDEQMEALTAIFGGTPEAPLNDAIYRVLGRYTHLLSEHIGWDEECLADWWLTHRFGDGAPMQAGLRGEPMRTITNNEDLARFIADDLEASPQEIKNV